MATRGNRPKDPRATKGGVRGTHGLGDAPREKKSTARAPGDGGGRAESATARDTEHTRALEEARRAAGIEVSAEEELDESVGEEREFELSNAMADLESADTWAERRERTARAVLESERRHAEAGEVEDDLAAWEVDSGAEGVLGDPRTDRQERRDRGLDTVKTHGPGPKDAGKGTARTKDLDDRGIARR